MAMTRVISGSIPKYRQVLQILRQQILSGELAPNAQLPTEDELSLRFGVSRGTVRKAIAQLEAERLIRTEQGVGSFVRAMHPNAIPFYFTDRSLENGTEEVVYRVLAQEVVPAPMEIAERLSLSPGTPVLHIARQRVVGGQVLAHAVRYLPESLCPTLLTEDLTTPGSIHSRIVRHSELPLLRAEIEVEAQLLSGEDAALLEVPSGTPAVVISRLTYTAPNRPAVYYRGLFRDEYQIGVRVGDAD